jgi:hypothetical protein
VRSVNVFEDGYEYDPEDPPGYRAGAMLISKELGARGLAVKSFVLDKIGAWPGNEADEVLLFRRDGNVGYYDGEV